MWRIHITYEFGEALGYVADSADFLGYLSRHSSRPEPILAKLPLNSLAVLQYMSVEGDYQGQGYGKTLLAEFEEKVDEIGAVAIFLIADINESQRDGFDLMKFYKKHGYRRIAMCSSGPVMFKRL